MWVFVAVLAAKTCIPRQKPAGETGTPKTQVIVFRREEREVAPRLGGSKKCNHNSYLGKSFKFPATLLFVATDLQP